MSRYTSNISNYSIICPYCNHEHVDSQDCDTGAFECEECARCFHVEVEKVIQYLSIPDCELDYNPHVWTMKDLGGGKKHEFCKICDCIKPLEAGNE